jgi:hypothetical protein
MNRKIVHLLLNGALALACGATSWQSFGNAMSARATLDAVDRATGVVTLSDGMVPLIRIPGVVRTSACNVEVPPVATMMLVASGQCAGCMLQVRDAPRALGPDKRAVRLMLVVAGRKANDLGSVIRDLCSWGYSVETYEASEPSFVAITGFSTVPRTVVLDATRRIVCSSTGRSDTALLRDCVEKATTTRTDTTVRFEHGPGSQSLSSDWGVERQQPTSGASNAR